MSGAMTEREIRKYLGPTDVVGREILCFKEIGSTNTYGKQLVKAGAVHGTAVFADSQTAGRGRMERTFQSPQGKGIYLSVLLCPDLSAEKLLPVTALAGVAVCDAVEHVCGIRPGLKWPNDPVLGKRKLCGILAETATDAAGRLWLILGIGINVLQQPGDFSPDVREMATSLAQETERPVSCAELAAAVLKELDGMYAAFRTQQLADYLKAYRDGCINLGKRVRLLDAAGESVEALAETIDERFSLVVRTDDGARRTVQSGEVSVRGMYGYAE